MRRAAARILLIIVWAALSQTLAQDLAPEVLLLSRIKQHMRQALVHLPNYTCLETIARFRQERVGKLKPADTVRLEIIYADGHEWFSLPGVDKFGVANPAEFVGAGMMGNGQFATTLSNVLEGARFVYRGEEALIGRMTAKYDFHLSRFLGASKVIIGGVSGTVGEDGTWWVDAQSLDLVRLETHAVEIPNTLPLKRANLVVDYARARIGAREVLIPRTAEMDMVDGAGLASLNQIQFTQCRAFSAESTLRFDTEPK